MNRTSNHLIPLLLAFPGFLAVIIPSFALSEARLRIVFTHDLHSTLSPVTLVAADGQRAQSGGYARLATALKRATAVNPDGTLIVDAGDFTMGTLCSMLFLSESPELHLMGAMGYDVITLGNHDFDFDFDGLGQYLANARAKGGRLPEVVVSNLDLSAPTPSNESLRKAFEEFGVSRLTVITRKGVRIGVFGIMGENAASDALIPGCASFGDAIETARQMVRVLRDSAKADLVLCLSHMGTSEGDSTGGDVRLAHSVPGIDVIVSGHTHRSLSNPLRVGSTTIVAAGSRGSHLGILDLQLVAPSHFAVEHYELMPIDSTLPADTTIGGEISDDEVLIDRQLSLRYGLTQHQVIAVSGFDFAPVEYGHEGLGETGLGDLIADAYRYAATKAGRLDEPPVDAVVVPMGLVRGSLVRGPITVADIFHVLSLGVGPDKAPGYPLISFYVTGGDLLNTLEIETTLAPLREDVHLQVSGVRFRYNPHRLPMNRVTDAEIIDSAGHGHPIVDQKLYHVCICLYSGIKITDISSMSHGIISIQPRREDGTLITDLNETLVDADSSISGTQELKAWMALLRYLQSFGTPGSFSPPVIPERYRTPAGRFVAEASWNPVDLVRKPNRVTFVTAIVALILLCCMIWICRKIIRHRSRQRAKETWLGESAGNG
jgi:5'-nucleotidase / UDP-sugar diphosphatase